MVWYFHFLWLVSALIRYNSALCEILASAVGWLESFLLPLMLIAYFLNAVFDPRICRHKSFLKHSIVHESETQVRSRHM